MCHFYFPYMLNDTTAKRLVNKRFWNRYHLVWGSLDHTFRHKDHRTDRVVSMITLAVYQSNI